MRAMASTDRKSLLALLRAGLNRRGLVLEPAEAPGRYVVTGPGLESLLISPDNIFTEIQRDGDPSILDGWLDAALAEPAALPPYLVARSGLRMSLEPASTEFGASIHAPLTPALAEVLCWTDPEERRITWITGATLDLWQARLDDVIEAARAGLDRVLRTASLEIQEVRGMPLGMLDTDSVFKASLVLAPSLKATVEPRLGWPVCAVAPCRDFLYLFRDADKDALIPLLAAVVTREYEGSGYALSTEVLRISDEGVLALGSYG